ncbi:glycosyltransferase family 4 protein [Chiayiivirga flava]|nr:glycosyltransferase family 1 protein [Chiayiivirga flava]
MRIALVTETYPPEVNGVALTVQGLEQGLRRMGHAVEVIRPQQGLSDAPDARQVLVPGAAVPRYPGLRFGWPAKRRLSALWRGHRPDAVYVATEGPLGWSAVRCARELGIPVATGFHTRFDDYVARYGAPFLSPLAFAWLRRFHNLADATLVPTRELSDFLRANRFARVELLSRAVDTELFSPTRRRAALRASWGLASADVAAIHVGRIAPEKNLELAVRAFRALQRQQPRARFVWVGDGPSRAALQAENPDFVFVGTQRGEALAEQFASADLFLFPSLSETFGNVTLEAMASGLATVAFDYGAAREHLRDRAHGRSLAREDADGFVQAAVELATRPDLRQRFGIAARAAVLPLRHDAVCGNFAALLADLRPRNAA